MNKENLRIPIAIVIAGVFVAGAILFSNFTSNGGSTGDNKKAVSTFDGIRPVDAKDHIVGNPAAPIVFVEFSDTECPYCKRFHGVMNQLVNEYGKTGQIAWVYRHMPIQQLHSKSPKEAQATECAASLGGEQKFWQLLNKIYEVTPGNDGLDLAQLPVLAASFGIDKTAFNDCLNSTVGQDVVENDYKDGLIATEGMPGTPHSVILLKKALSKDTEDQINLAFAKVKVTLTVSTNRKAINMSGALPYELVKVLIDTISAQK